MQKQEREFDLYVTDGRYPLKPGGAEELACFEFYKQIRAINPNARVVIASADDSLEKLAKEQRINFVSKGNFDKGFDKVWKKYFGGR